MRGREHDVDTYQSWCPVAVRRVSWKAYDSGACSNSSLLHAQSLFSSRRNEHVARTWPWILRRGHRGSQPRMRHRERPRRASRPWTRMTRLPACSPRQTMRAIQAGRLARRSSTAPWAVDGGGGESKKTNEEVRVGLGWRMGMRRGGGGPMTPGVELCHVDISSVQIEIRSGWPL